MFEPYERANREFFRAKTREQRDAIIRQLIQSETCGKTPDALFEYHLEKLEIVSSHLATIVRGLPHLTTIKDISFMSAFAVDTEMVEEMIARGRIKFEGISAMWPVLWGLLFKIHIYEGDHKSIENWVWLAHRAAKIMLEAWRNSMRPGEVSSMYYSPEEDSFANDLPWPISSTMAVNRQFEAMIANIRMMK